MAEAAQVQPVTSGAEQTESKSDDAFPGAAEADALEGSEAPEKEVAASPEIPEYKKVKHKVKTPDGESEVDYDELVRSYQKSKTLTQREQENARLYKEAQTQKKQLEGFFEKAKEDPSLIWQLAKELGHDTDQLAVQKAYELMEYERKSPEEKRAIAAERERDVYRAEVERIKQQEMMAQKAQHAEAVAREVEDDVLAVAKELEGQVEIDPWVMEDIATILQSRYASKGYSEKPNPKDVAERVLARQQQVADRELLRQLKTGKLPDYLASRPDIKKAIQRALVDEARKDLPSIPPSSPAASGSKSAKPKKIGVNKFFDSL